MGDIVATDSFGLGFSTKAVGRARDVDCPRCEMAAGVNCENETGAPHVERGRLARWVEMLHL
jgi:hypothetical protein